MTSAAAIVNIETIPLLCAMARLHFLLSGDRPAGFPDGHRSPGFDEPWKTVVLDKAAKPLINMADEVGFEPTGRLFSKPTVFKTVAINHSTTHPNIRGGS